MFGVDQQYQLPLHSYTTNWTGQPLDYFTTDKVIPELKFHAMKVY
jgi:hypothetical protein